MTFWDGTRWVTDADSRLGSKPERRRVRDILATLVIIAGLVGLVVPSVASSAATQPPASRLVASWSDNARVKTYQESSPHISYRGSWGVTKHARYLGDRARYSNKRLAKASLNFTGTGVAWIGPIGPTRGKAKIYIDGKYVTTVNTYSTMFRPTRVLFERTFKTERPRRFTIVTLGTKGHPTVALDAILVRRGSASQPEPKPELAPAPTPSPSPTATQAASPTATPTSAPSPTPAPTPSPSPTATQAASPTATPTSAPSPTPATTPSPAPTASPTPTRTPLIARFDFVQSPTTLDVSFTNTSSGPLTAWLWDFGDGSPPDLTANPVHQFAAAGTYSVRLDVSDGTTTDSFTTSVVVEGGPPTPTPTAQPAPTTTPPIPPPDSLTCSATVHAKYSVVGPDGKAYAAWHPQRDPSGCYFHHDHGSDPSLFAAADEYQPSFGYVTAQAGTSEPHAGFKNFLYETNGYHWLFTVHIGTAGPARVCTRYHSIDLAIARMTDGQLMAVVHFMADFGRAEDNRTLAALTPDACPNQYFAAVADDSYGVRQLSVNDPDDTQYEPWKPDLRRVILGLTAPGLEFNTVSAMTTCNGLTCNTVSPTGHPGAGVWRMLDHETGMVFKAGTRTGAFTTDAYGGSAGGSVHQFVQPGTNVAAGPNSGAEHAWPSDRTAMIYRCVIGNGPTTAASTNIDGQIRMPN